MDARDPETGQIQSAFDPKAILDLFDDRELPFITSQEVAAEFDCSQQTARNKLAELVDKEVLERVDLGRRSAVWIRADYTAGQEVLDTLREYLELGNIDLDFLTYFAAQPYKILPKSENEYYCIVPRFVPFEVGHLRDQDEAWQTYVINKYVAWIDEIPESVRRRIDLPQRFDHAEIDDGILEVADTDERDEVLQDEDIQEHLAPGQIPSDDVLLDMDYDELRSIAKHQDEVSGNWSHPRILEGLQAVRDEDPEALNRIQIKPGHEFEVVRQLIEDGNLPFKANPVDDDFLRPPPANIELRPYQERAWEMFKQYGQIGVFWPPRGGKTFIAMYAGERIAGEKLVIVPSATLETQWTDRINQYCDRPDEWDIRTYQYLTTNNNMQGYQGRNAPALTVYDEVHVLPANTYAKLSTLDTTFRIGTSATPYREDQRTDAVFALCGVPIGVEWQELMEHTDIEYPDVDVFLYASQDEKRRDLEDLALRDIGKTLVFVERIDAGKELEKLLDVPFIYGETPKENRLDIIANNRVVIASRVADEGISIADLDRVIEYQFHGSSRRQELQRAGRVMHGAGVGHHIVQMTDEEYNKFSRRLYSLEEKGIDIRLERRGKS